MAFETLIKELKDFEMSIEDLVIEFVDEAQAIELNSFAQLHQGRDANDDPIAPAYTPFTVKIKRAKGQPTNRVTLFDTGDFYEGFKVVKSQNEFFVTSTDEKTASLKRKYGDDIFGLTDDSKDELRKEITPLLIQSFRKLLT